MEESYYLRRFGSVAISEGFLTMEQFINAMKTQVKEEVERGEHTLIGEILVEMGVVDRPKVEKVLKAMKKKKA